MKKVLSENAPNAHGEIEFIIRDRNGMVLGRHVEKNIVKIFAKEILANRVPYSKIWNPNVNSGEGAWEDSGIDALEEMAPKYILLGASYDSDGVPLEFEDDRYYTFDSVTNKYVPIRLNPGAEYDGGLINPITILEPDRPLKRIESIEHEASYQPSGTPLLQDDVRAMNNVVVFETTIKPEEYNGFGLVNSDYFTITEVALAGGKVLDSVGACDCTPRELFLDGVESSATAERPLQCVANGGDTITIDPSETEVDLIKKGDQIRIGGVDDAIDDDTISDLNQVTPYYLVLDKSVGGRDILLDRAVVDNTNTPIVGDVGVLRDTLRIFSHRILTAPIRKTSDIELVVRWRIIFN